MNDKKPKIALAHDFLAKIGGAEKVLQVFAEMYPDAPIYTMFYDEEKVGHVFAKERIRTSWLQKFPKFIRKRYRLLLKFMPNAVESFDLSKYDIVLSSSTAYMHGLVTSLETKHICYCHSPTRYLWDYTHKYLDEQKHLGILKPLVRKIFHKLRMWDQAAGDRPDQYIANSKHVQKRIKKFYKQDSVIIHPPVDLSNFKATKEHQGYFLCVGRLTPYKKFDLVIELFNKLQKQLVIVGEGSWMEDLKRIAGPTIDFVGFKEDRALALYYENARALIFPNEEDFGIVPIEAMAAGKPVLAYKKGALIETVEEGVTGEFFDEQTIESMEKGLTQLIRNEKSYDYKKIRLHAEGFGVERFKKEIENVIFSH